MKKTLTMVALALALAVGGISAASAYSTHHGPHVAHSQELHYNHGVEVRSVFGVERNWGLRSSILGSCCLSAVLKAGDSAESRVPTLLLALSDQGGAREY